MAADCVVGSLFDDIGGENDGAAAAETPLPRIRFVVGSFPMSQVREENKVRFNTNNHWDVEPAPDGTHRLVARPTSDTTGKKIKVCPDDYALQCSYCRTSQWIDLFHSHYRVVNLPRRHLGWMQRASNFAILKEGLSPMYKHDVEDAVATTNVGDTFLHAPSSGYFVRTESVSLKEGIHGVGPYFGLKEIIESSITASGGHQGVDQSTTAIKFFLMPWVSDLHRDREFRVFVRESRVTAISQQALYNVNDILDRVEAAGLDPHDVVRAWSALIVAFVEHDVMPRLATIGRHTAVMDIALLGPDPASVQDVRELPDVSESHRLRPYFIEINPFGYGYPAGSSLFSWIDDYATLYGLAEGGPDNATSSAERTVAVRYTRRG